MKPSSKESIFDVFPGIISFSHYFLRGNVGIGEQQASNSLTALFLRSRKAVPCGHVPCLISSGRGALGISIAPLRYY